MVEEEEHSGRTIHVPLNAAVLVFTEDQCKVDLPGDYDEYNPALVDLHVLYAVSVAVIATTDPESVVEIMRHGVRLMEEAKQQSDEGKGE